MRTITYTKIPGLPELEDGGGGDAGELIRGL